MSGPTDVQILEQLSNGMANVVEEAASFTVLVDARKRLPVSGVLIKPDMVVTVDHGIETEENIRVLIPGGGLVTAVLAGRDAGSDLAILRLEQKVDVGKFPKPRSARVGQPVIAVGKPEPEGVQASFGIVTTTGEGLRTMKGTVLDRYIATDATPYPGFSGGPLLAITGEVLGLNTSGLIGGLSLAIPYALVLGVASQLEQHGRVKRGYLGIRSQRIELSKNLKEGAGVEQTSGLLLVGIEPNGPAESGGLIVGDILMGIDNQPVLDQDDLFMRLNGDVVGKSIALKLLRGGKTTVIEVTIRERA